MLNNYNIQTGYLIDNENKAFDVSVILNFPTEADYENAATLADFPCVNLIDFYFGEPNDRDTETYLKQFIEKQHKFRKLADKLLDLIAANPDDTDLREQYDFVKLQIVDLH